MKTLRIVSYLLIFISMLASAIYLQGTKTDVRRRARIYLAAYGHLQYTLVSDPSLRPEHAQGLKVSTLVFQKDAYLGYVNTYGEYVPDGYSYVDAADRHWCRIRIARFAINWLPQILFFLAGAMASMCVRSIVRRQDTKCASQS